MFQIEQNFGKSCKGWIYFESNEKELAPLIDLARTEANKDWNRLKMQRSILHNPTPARPTITVAEYDSGTNKKVKGGIRFKTKWR